MRVTQFFPLCVISYFSWVKLKKNTNTLLNQFYTFCPLELVIEVRYLHTRRVHDCLAINQQ